MSLKVLYIGDVHAVQSELDDCERLFDLVFSVVRDHKPDAVIHLGDGYNNHGTVNVDVVAFWKNIIRRFEGTNCEFIWILGNHEMTGVAGSPNNALNIHSRDNVLCVTKPMIWNDFLLMPYQDKPEDFVKKSRSYSNKRMVCHQSFQGAQFENSFFDPNGVNPDDVHQEHIISGHIHLPGWVGTKIRYPGAPRWRTLSDANTNRFLLLCEYEDNKIHPVSSVEIPTDKVCRVIYSIKDTPTSPFVGLLQTPGEIQPRVHLDIYGSVDRVRERKSQFEGSGYRIRTFPDQVKKSSVKESDGITVAFNKYVDNYLPTNGSNKLELDTLVKDRVSCLLK